jgi:hypothetical protein
MRSLIQRMDKKRGGEPLDSLLVGRYRLLGRIGAGMHVVAIDY